MNKLEIQNLKNIEWIGKNVYYHEKTGSTNIDAKQLAEESTPHGTLVVAEEQTDARGRRGRSWQAPAGSNIYFSLVLRPRVAADKAPMLTLVMALSVARAVSKQCGLEAKIKWPNDIVVNKKKVCGILTEMTLEGRNIAYVIVGVGINVNQQEFPEDIRETATSLRRESGKVFSREELLQKVLKYFEADYESFLKTENMSLLRNEYNGWLVNRGVQVKVLEPSGEYTGTAQGINENGELLVERENGQLEAVYAGEVSVRGIYGYV